MKGYAEGLARRVLVVEDDEDSAAALVLLLRHDGHEVSTALDGRTALVVASQLRPDVVVLDLCLRDMSGFELASALRAGGAAGAALLVALTGLDGEDVRARCRAAGIDCHLVKPIRDFAGFRRLVSSLELSEGSKLN